VSVTVDLMRAMIRNRCVNDGTRESGQEKRSVQTLQDFFGVEGQVFEPAPGRQSLVYRVKGSDPDHPSIALVPHLDVVPADASGWSVDPFAAEVVDGAVYGRGAVDMLNVTAAMAVAARPYIRGESTARADLVFCATADEEAGSRFGAWPLVRDRWDLVGVDYLLSEVAYPGLPAEGHRRVPVSIGEKGAYWSILEAAGTPGHGSAPYGTDNAISKLVAALAGIEGTPAPAAIDDIWIEFVDALPLDDETKSRLGDVDAIDEAIDEIAVTDPSLARYVHAATHLTISANVFQGGSKTNVVPDRARAELDIRSLPDMDRRYVDTHLRKAMGMASDYVEIEPVLDGDSTISERNTLLWEAISAAVLDLEGHSDLVPAVMTVATDARFWRARGTVAYGVGLFDDSMSFSEMLTLFHGHDEHVSLESVDRTAALYGRVLEIFMAER
jgi:acetylornithine deacetylase/succinyl-diaminopimelate desuccinylase-like protein